jgi:hypothetical protein
MSNRNWKREYRQVLRQHAPAAPVRRKAPDHRTQPRLQTRGVAAWIGVTPGLHLIAISARRMEFYADHAFRPGLHLRVQVDTAPPVHAEVLDCRLEETDPGLLELRYRVRCRLHPVAKRA